MRVIKFSAEWCGPCRTYDPIFDKVSKQLVDVEFIKCDVDEDENEMVSKYGIRSIPSTIIEKEGKVVHRFLGSKTENELISIIMSYAQ